MVHGKPLRGDARVKNRRDLLLVRLATRTAAGRIAAACDYFRGIAVTVHPAVVEAAADALVPVIVQSADDMAATRKDVPA